MTSLPLDTAVLLAMEYLHTNQPQPAAGICDQALALQPNHEQALLLKIALLRQAGDLDGALDYCRRLLASPSAFRSTPRAQKNQDGPLLLDQTLARVFGRDTPPVSDISDHVPILFSETVAAQPKLVVELGTRGGESTRALLAGALRCGAKMLSIDVDPCGDPPGLPDDARAIWTFIQHDDVSFGRDRFVPWCEAQGLAPQIDVLFIDTSHLYEHTKDELAVWLPYVAPSGVTLFHDTAMSPAYLRNDGSIGFGWDNERGVIRAIEEYVGRRYDENRYFVDIADDWLIRHDPKSSGFTVMQRLAGQNR